MRISSSRLRVIRLLWTALFSLFLILNVDQFAYSAGAGPAPKFWMLGIFSLTLIMFLPGLKLGVLLSRPLLGWTAGYVLLSAAWVGHADNLESAIDGWMMVVTTGLLVVTALLAYPSVAFRSRVWTAMLWAALILAVLSVVEEYSQAAAYVFAEAGQGIEGRAAGLFLNPNIAAQALIMILACLMAHGSPRANVIALALSAIGMLLTFSRGGILAWVVLAVAATARGRLPKWFILVLATCAALFFLMGDSILEALSAWIAPENRNSLERLAWLLGQGELTDFSAGEREAVASFAWQQFLASPVLGHGVGYMWVWTADAGTHNLFLRFMVEYGTLGILIFPLFLIASVRSSVLGSDRAWMWFVACIAVMLSMFSHNMMEQATFLLPWLALCLMPEGPSR